MPAMLEYRPYDLYMTDRKETMAILQKGTHTSPHLQIRPSLVHPLLSEDKLVIQMHLDVTCNARHLASKNENKRQKNIWTVVQSHDRGHSGQGGLVVVC